MVWWQLSFICKEEQVSHLAQLLDDVGAIAVMLCAGSDEALVDGAVGSDSLWKVTMIRGLFPGTTDVADLASALKGMFAPDALPPYTVEALPDRDWSTSWQSYFEPIKVGERLWIGPSWYRPPAADTINVVLDPGRAFGTGMHATTALCLDWLESEELGGADVIDYGCGSGILAIAAVKLGARHVFAVDTDPNALSATQKNALRNGVEGVLTALFPDALPARQADILVANILADPLIALAPRFAALVRDGGSVVLSGILEGQSDAVAAACQPWFRVRGAMVREGWVRMLGQRFSQGG
jgi:ribosomal protein L11 methyltransferase